MFRYALSRRWIAWHLFCVAAVVVMVVAGICQWAVAFESVDANGQPSLNVRNLVYAVQWWVFAAFGIWFWFRFLRDQRDAELAEMVAAADAAVEQVADLSAGTKTESQASQVPELISLDDSAEERRARARELRTGDQSAASAPSSTELGMEGKRQ